MPKIVRRPGHRVRGGAHVGGDLPAYLPAYLAEHPPASPDPAGNRAQRRAAKRVGLAAVEMPADMTKGSE